MVSGHGERRIRFGSSLPRAGLEPVRSIAHRIREHQTHECLITGLRVEYLHDTLACRTLFATHYHELAQLAASLPRLRNYNVLVRELADEIVFLHKIAPGNAERSYGIHVARLAGVPGSVLARATAVLGTLEKGHDLSNVPAAPVAAPDVTRPIPLPTPATPPRVESPKPKIVQPPEAPRRKSKPQAATGPSLFGDGDDMPF
ncbi:DNA mismatch repair protein MutS [Gemmata obscuriglobus]|uniref:MutS-related protein n=1 Tax=Gemmata obscuriglobus TaxID=114 RepID=UPI00016C58FD|nr:DNA mismatch repair protein [Gemmata obscuriglobus]QEG27764.1 DNA mismatch repair protein MutS [Gemmata obscuriglobus]VTS05054.1 dna mismatch repair protein : DNA mismatch repair protein MutS OS=Rhodopirellula maiorica SM1 GN=RMSM_02032 PE=4 SV=1: MutS_V [Gemmata obscuriglobus UQM 2246]